MMDWVVAYLAVGLMIHYLLELGNDWLEVALWTLFWLPLMAWCLLVLLLEER